MSGFPLLKIEKFLELHIHNPLVQPHNTISTFCQRVMFQLNISKWKLDSADQASDQSYYFKYDLS